MIPQKRCAGCTNIKPISDFGIDRKRKDGLNPYCRKCRSTHKKAYRATYRDRLSEQQRAYKQRPEVKERGAAWMRQKRAANPELARRQTRETMRRQRATPEGAERSRSAVRRWRTQHPEKAREAYQRWRKTERGKAIRNALNHQRETRKAGNGGSHTADDWAELKARYDYRCLRCGRCEPAIKLTADHVIPTVLGGSNDITNIQPLCKFCNSAKGTKTTDYH